MKIKLEKQVTTTEEVEIETPAYFRNNLGQYYLINDHGMIKISGGYIFITAKYKLVAERCFNDHLYGAYDPEEISESEFNEAYQAFIERCNSMVYAPAEI